ncbi:thioesterase domain-containing protein [Dolichospermum planctonicum UHCC 0167]|uniref:type I polyketide synthase n=1 Tax=Dolichospermum planctonicum TaxID=136072 RepID=UPI001443042C|nr:type I polyketide synthase [Dolichospermum planctonicum]MCW9680554.1 thioesterase domain-containing protein [Dolichospermum planctonicum UHCC 0167]
MLKEYIAIVGMGCRFPGASNLNQFWTVIRDGIDTITEAPTDRPTEMTGWGGFLKGIDKFDAAFFGVSPEEAIKMDPQHRLLLEVTWEALEDAGLIPANLVSTNTGVFTGVSGSEYLKLLNEDPTFSATVGTVECMMANRVSSYFDFRGPSLVINTTCSSALVAIDQACHKLWNGEISLALVGGTNLTFSPVIATRFANGNLLSADGRCKVFDAKADGYVRGEGIGVVVLKRLSQAQIDGDRIYAVIRGSGVNHNGSGNGLTAPNMQAQIDLLQKVYQQANIDPSSINYIEAHGTATLIGDALEMKALGTVVGKDRTSDHPCRVGCVKTNIGHTEAASGIAGLIKVALSLYNRQIPPNLHFQEPNPAIPFAKLGLKVQETLEILPEEISPIRAGVSAFGLGGTNAHVLLESVSSPAKAESNLFPLQIFTLTAKSPTALQALAQRYQAFLEDKPEASLVDICFTANTRRSQFKHRLAMITESKEELSNQLNIYLEKESLSSIFSGQITRRKPAPVCFIFSGSGDKIKPLIKLFYKSQPALDSLLEPWELILDSHVGKSFLELIEEENLENIVHSQLVNFLCEYAIAQLWKYWGVEPAILIGYGAGNYTALVLAEILTLEDIISLILKKQDLTSNQNFRPAKIPVVSSITGNTIQINQIIDFKQWQKEFDFTNSNVKDLPDLLSDYSQILLDICSIQMKNYDIDYHEIKSDNLYSLFSTLIKLWLMGVKIDWSKIEDYKQCYPISLPTYPFERQSYWINTSSTIFNSQSENQITNNQNKSEQLDQEFVAPRDEIEQQLANIWQKVLGHKSIGIHDNFFELGGSSFLAAGLFAQIETVFQNNMPISAIFQAPTIEKLAKLLRSEVEIFPWYSLVPIQPKGSRPILFGIHHIYYQYLSRHLGKEQPIYALHYGIADTTGTRLLLPKMEDLAAHYIKEMRSLQPEGPYFLMGVSFGGLVAYEMSQQLIAQGQQVGLLAVFDTTIESPRKLLLRQRLSNLLRLSPAELLKRIKSKFLVLRYGNQYLPHIYNPAPIISTFRAYTPKTYSGRVNLFKAMDKLLSLTYKIDPLEVGWKKFVTGELEIHEIPGTHMGILEEPNVQLLAEKLTACIDKALGDAEI